MIDIYEVWNSHPAYCDCPDCLDYLDYCELERPYVMNWRYFELVEGVHNKFWMIARHENGRGFTARWGKIGSAGQMQMKNFPSVSMTNKAFSDKINEKIRKNYVPRHSGNDFLTAEGTNMYRPGMRITNEMKHVRRRESRTREEILNEMVPQIPKKKKAKKKNPKKVTPPKPKFKIRIKKRKVE